MRRIWIQLRQARMRAQPGRLVFVDETATSTKLTRLRGRAPLGERVDAKAPAGRWATQTFIAALRCHGLTAPWVIDGPLNRERFEAYVEHQLAPTLRPGDVVILDNLSVHDSARAKARLAERGAWFLFLPAHSDRSWAACCPGADGCGRLMFGCTVPSWGQAGGRSSR
jgi:hypothetical protein